VKAILSPCAAIEPGTRKKGASGREEVSIRGLITVLKQIGRTFDIQTTPMEQVLGLLPPEFDKGKEMAGIAAAAEN
jgi:hypothetical protein